MSYLQHDRSKDLVGGKTLNTELPGETLFVKLPDGKEIKAGLCKRTPQGILIVSRSLSSPKISVGATCVSAPERRIHGAGADTQVCPYANSPNFGSTETMLENKTLEEIR